MLPITSAMRRALSPARTCERAREIREVRDALEEMTRAPHELP